MLGNIAYILFFLLLAMALGQYLVLRLFLNALREGAVCSEGSSEPEPRVAVIVCLRGSDPFLEDCLLSLASQDYPAYDLRIVVDSVDDPAWEVVNRVVQVKGGAGVHVTTLHDPLDTCSLKCSSLCQAIGELDDSYEVIALADADTLAHPTWLRELVAPLADEDVGAATGNRWYMPQRASLASIVRYLWNAAAVPQMCCLQIPWGGTLAIKRRVFRDSEILERWRQAFCEDTMVYGVLRKMGLRVVFVPSLMMVNREDCTLRSFLQWLRRQLLAARLYHPHWIGTLIHAIGTGGAWLGAVAVALAGVFTGSSTATLWGLLGAVTYVAIMLCYQPMIEIGVRKVLRRRGEAVNWIRPRTMVMIPLACMLLQFVYPLTLLSTICLRRIRWRGIDYSVCGSGQVRMRRYSPHSAAAAELESL